MQVLTRDLSLQPSRRDSRPIWPASTCAPFFSVHAAYARTRRTLPLCVRCAFVRSFLRWDVIVHRPLSAVEVEHAAGVVTDVVQNSTLPLSAARPASASRPPWSLPLMRCRSGPSLAEVVVWSLSSRGYRKMIVGTTPLLASRRNRPTRPNRAGRMRRTTTPRATCVIRGRLIQSCVRRCSRVEPTTRGGGKQEEPRGGMPGSAGVFGPLSFAGSSAAGSARGAWRRSAPVGASNPHNAGLQVARARQGSISARSASSGRRTARCIRTASVSTACRSRGIADVRTRVTRPLVTPLFGSRTLMLGRFAGLAVLHQYPPQQHGGMFR